MPERLAGPDDLAGLARVLLAMDDQERRAFLAGLPEDDVIVCERALAGEVAVSWRSNPASMAVHFGALRPFPYTMLLGEKFRDAVEGRSTRQIWNLSPQSGKPVGVDEPVLMGDGSTRRLGDVKVGDTVITHLGRSRPVLAVHHQGQIPVRRITTGEGREIVAAPDHPFLTAGGWVQVDDLQAAREGMAGDVLAVVCPGAVVAAGSTRFGARPAPGTVLTARPQSFEWRWQPDPVLTVTDAGECECRCLSVADDASFVVNGVAVHNSVLASQWGPAWALDRHPNRRLILTSYGDDLADRNSYAVRNILREHRDELHVKLRRDQQRQDRFTTPEGGGILAAGIGSGITGWGAHGIVCFTAGTQVATPGGSASIETLDGGDRVLAYDTAEGRVVEAFVSARRVSRAGELVEIRFASRRRFTCTPEHPVFVPALGAYVPAADLESGTAVVGLPSGRYGPLSATVDHVAATARVDAGYAGTTVYDLSVDGTANFFAEGVLVHNCDDPHKNWVDAHSAASRERVYSQFRSVLRTRLTEEWAFIIVVMCMTGDTPVLMADDVERPLADIRPGDRVATYDRGVLTSARVLNWANQGSDTVYEVRMKSGRRVRANARHPFRVIQENGVAIWVRLGSLRAGMRVRSVEVPISVSSAPPRDAKPPLSARACACSITARSAGLPDIDHLRLPTRPNEPSASRAATGSPSTSTTSLFSARTGGVPSVAYAPTRSPGPSIGVRSSASTTTTTPEPCGACSVTTAISSSPERIPSVFSSPPSHTWRVATDEVVEIVEAGVEDVFDIEVEDTHNFIANGLEVSNTRWHEDDLTGRLIEAWQNGTGEEYEVIRLPEVAEAPDPDSPNPILRLPDPLGRVPGQILEPRRFSKAAVAARKLAAGTYLWVGLHQQRPSPEEGTEIKRAWFRLEDAMPDHADEWLVSVDPKLKDKESGDYVVGQVWCRTGADYWLVDQLRGQWNQATTINAIALLSVRHPQVVRHVVENTGNGPEVMAALRKPQPGYVVDSEMAGQLGMTELEALAVGELRRRGLPGLIPNTPRGDKSVRMRAHAPLLEAGNVHVNGRASWLGAFLEEAASFPNGSNDDQCLSADTLVLRPDGACRIADVAVGDMVLGRSGWVDVLAAGRTGTARTYSRLGIRATAAHPVLTGRGWVSFLDVTHDDTILSCDAKPWTVTETPRSERSAVSATSDAGVWPKASLLAVPDPPTASWTAVRQQAIWFAGCAISTMGDGENTATRFMWWAPSRELFASNPSSSTGSSSGAIRTPRTPRTAATTSPTVAGLLAAFRHFIKRSGRRITARSRPAGTSTTSTGTSATTDPRTSNASPSRTIGGSTPLPVPPTAGVPSNWPTSRPSAISPWRGTAHRRDGHGIASTLPSRRRPASSLDVEAVFNLTTSDGTYFANGVLVHNCDAMSQALSKLSKGPASVSSPTQTRVPSPATVAGRPSPASVLSPLSSRVLPGPIPLRRR